MLNESDIQKLLRLKRYEQPAPEYFDKFLQDFHRRQRAELLRQPAWKIVLERVETFFSEHSMGRYAYATATAAVLFFSGITSMGILNSSSPAPSLVKNTSVGPVPHPAPMVAEYQASAQHPRYVIDTRPASYERSFSF